MIYRRLFFFLVALLIISTALMMLLYQSNQLWASFFSNISTGCVTGLIFLIYQNLKDRDIKKFDKQVEDHSRICFELNNINDQFRRHQSSLIVAEGDDHRYHLSEAVKYAKHFIRKFSLLAITCPNYYRDLTYNALGVMENFGDIMDKVNWLESRLGDPPPERDDRIEYITVAHNIHCAFFDIIIKMNDTETDLTKKRNTIEKSIV